MTVMERPYSVPQVAGRFDVTSQTVRNWIASGRLRSVQATPRGRHRIPADALETFERDARSAGSRPADAASSPVERRRIAQLNAATELARVVSAIVAAIGPDAVLLFGSRARGDARPDSDFDLAIVVPDGVERRGLAMRAYETIARVEGRTVGVDIVVLTPGIIAAERDLVGSIARAVVREGVPVYGSAAFA
jgi:excisionase family DNA binding protein